MTADPTAVAALERAMEEVWRAGGRPDFIEIGGRMYQTLEGELARLEALDRVRTPQGLRTLFPSLRG